MPRLGESANWRSALPFVALLAVGSLACGSGCRHESGSGESGPTGGSAAPPAMPGSGAAVGNSDPHGVENQPDWSGMARELRVRVSPRMPRELPADRQTACTQMLDSAVSFYESTEASQARRKQRLDELTATREDDLSECVKHTSIEAAVCVSVLLGDRDSEYPWLLDQCERAFPADATG